MSWIDIFIVASILIFTIIGAYKGILKEFLSIAVLLLSFFSAKLLSKPVSGWLIQNTNIRDNIAGNIAPNTAMTTEGVPSWIESMHLYKVPKPILDFFSNLWEQGTQSTGSALEIFTKQSSNIILTFFTFIVILLVAYIVFNLLSDIINLIGKLPVINVFNTLGGILFALAKAILLNMVIISILFVIALYFGNETIATALNNSIFASYFYVGYILF